MAVMGHELSDCYEILQVSRRADPIMITKAYRLLAALYHPDNRETGDEERFREVVEAYRELADPVRRAAYDRANFGGTASSSTRLNATDTAIVDVETGQTAQDERQLRRLVLQALYNLRRNRPYSPGLSLMVVAELLGSSIEAAQFTIWYLRGKKFIEITDDDGIAITVAGIDCLEEDEAQAVPEGPSPLRPSLTQHIVEVPARSEAAHTNPMSSGSG